MSTASMWVAPLDSAMATSEPEPAPTTSTSSRELSLIRRYGVEYCCSPCSSFHCAGAISWCGTPLTEMSTKSGLPGTTSRGGHLVVRRPAGARRPSTRRAACRRRRAPAAIASTRLRLGTSSTNATATIDAPHHRRRPQERQHREAGRCRRASRPGPSGRPSAASGRRSSGRRSRPARRSPAPPTTNTTGSTSHAGGPVAWSEVK